MVKCPKCNRVSQIYNSRYTKYGKWRREECKNCGNKFTSVEIPQEEYELLKKKGRDYERIMSALKEGCENK